MTLCVNAKCQQTRQCQRRCVVRRCVLPEEDCVEGRQACQACTEGIRRHLRQIEAYLPMVALMPHLLSIPGYGEGRRSPGFGSKPPPGLIDALNLLDLRVDVDGEGETSQSVLWRLDSICRLVQEEYGEPYEASMPGTITYLLRTAEWCAYQPWADEHASNIASIHAEVRAKAHDMPGKELAKCLLVGCEGKVYWSRDVDDPTDSTGQRKLDCARCVQCSRLYFGADLARLRAQEVS